MTTADWIMVIVAVIFSLGLGVYAYASWKHYIAAKADYDLALHIIREMGEIRRILKSVHESGYKKEYEVALSATLQRLSHSFEVADMCWGDLNELENDINRQVSYFYRRIDNAHVEETKVHAESCLMNLAQPIGEVENRVRPYIRRR